MSGPHFVRAGLLSLILFCPACLYGCAAATAPLWDGVQFCPAWCDVRAACWHDQQQAIYFSNALVIGAQLHPALRVSSWHHSHSSDSSEAANTAQHCNMAPRCSGTDQAHSSRKQ